MELNPKTDHLSREPFWVFPYVTQTNLCWLGLLTQKTESNIEQGRNYAHFEVSYFCSFCLSFSFPYSWISADSTARLRFSR